MFQLCAHREKSQRVRGHVGALMARAKCSALMAREVHFVGEYALYERNAPFSFVVPAAPSTGLKAPNEIPGSFNVY